MTKNTFRLLNKVRVDLISKKYDEGLSQEETVELDRLQEEVGSYIREHYPRSNSEEFNDYIDEMYDRLVERMEGKQK